MNKSRLLGTVGACVFASITTTTNAALIDNGTYTTDTVSGLDWLDLNQTINTTYSQAKASQPGWHYATNVEVGNLFSKMFDGYYDTNSSGSSDSTQGAYADQLEDTNLFIDLFGEIDTGPITVAWGWYRGESNGIHVLGAARYDVDYPADGHTVDDTIVFGPDYTNSSTPYPEDNPHVYIGTYLVRTSAVPVPAAVWLFGFGLLGLIGIARRKKA